MDRNGRLHLGHEVYSIHLRSEMRRAIVLFYIATFMQDLIVCEVRQTFALSTPSAVLVLIYSKFLTRTRT